MKTSSIHQGTSTVLMGVMTLGIAFTDFGTLLSSSAIVPGAYAATSSYSSTVSNTNPMTSLASTMKRLEQRFQEVSSGSSGQYSDSQRAKLTTLLGKIKDISIEVISRIDNTIGTLDRSSYNDPLNILSELLGESTNTSSSNDTQVIKLADQWMKKIDTGIAVTANSNQKISYYTDVKKSMTEVREAAAGIIATLGSVSSTSNNIPSSTSTRTSTVLTSSGTTATSVTNTTTTGATTTTTAIPVTATPTRTQTTVPANISNTGTTTTSTATTPAAIQSPIGSLGAKITTSISTVSSNTENFTATFEVAGYKYCRMEYSTSSSSGLQDFNGWNGSQEYRTLVRNLQTNGYSVFKLYCKNETGSYSEANLVAKAEIFKNCIGVRDATTGIETKYIEHGKSKQFQWTGGKAVFACNNGSISKSDSTPLKGDACEVQTSDWLDGYRSARNFTVGASQVNTIAYSKLKPTNSEASAFCKTLKISQGAGKPELNPNPLSILGGQISETKDQFGTEWSWSCRRPYFSAGTMTSAGACIKN